MKRLPGILIAAILLLLGSLFELLFAALAVFTGVLAAKHPAPSPGATGLSGLPAPAWLPLFIYTFGALLVVLAVWNVVTAIGLFRVRRWARYSVLVIGACMAIFGLPSAAVGLVMLFVPLPASPALDASQAATAHTMARAVISVGEAFYLIVAGLGIFWMIYFNLAKVREVFLIGAGPFLPSRRPFLISVLAVLSLIGAASCLLMAILPLPAAFLGFILHGTAKSALYLVYAGLLAASGIGLWSLQEWGRRLALALQAIALVQYIAYLAQPAAMLRYNTELSQAMHIAQPGTEAYQTVFYNQSALYDSIFIIGILFAVAIALVLHIHRGAFRRPPLAAVAPAPQA